MKIISLFFFVGFMQSAFAQQGILDSLFSKLDIEKNTDKRVDLINEFFANTAEVNPLLDLDNSQKILLHAQNNKDKISEVIALSNIGYDYRALGNTAKSFEYDLNALQLAIETGNEKSIGNAQLNLGHNYKDELNYTKALELYKSAAAISITKKDYLLQCWTFGNLADVYIWLNKPDSALPYAQKAYELCIQAHYMEYMPNILRELAEIHGKIGNKELALSYFNTGIKKAIEINSLRWLNSLYGSLGNFYFIINQPDSGFLYAKKAIDIVKNTPFSNKSIYASKLLLDIYENTNSDSAIKYFKIYKAANDSLFSSKTLQQTQAMKLENEMREKKLKEEKLSEEEQRRENIQLSFIAFGIITLLIMFLLLSRSFITNTKMIEFLGIIALLIVFEFLNLLLHPFLERVTHHSPILMLLALVCIAALLVPWHHKLEKWATAKLIEKNKQIRLAAAKKTVEQLEKA
ncbi:MAG: tetratricopeptide repeat protein [Ferruginibacter sp.]